MKHFYLSLIAGVLAFQGAQAQLTLTKAAFEPVIGDVNALVEYDTSAVLPKSTGTGQTWNFSSLSQSTAAAMSSTFVATSSSTASAQFPTATLAEDMGMNSYNFYKASANQFEMLGTDGGGAVMQFTNTMIRSKWPFAYGDNFSDTYSGSMSVSFMTIHYSGSLTSTASGSGNIILPGGDSHSNILQVKTAGTLTISLTFPTPTTQAISTMSYEYYHSSSKFPLLTVTYDEDNVATVNVNKKVAVGLTDYNFDAGFAIYPNPANESFNVRLSNTASADCVIQIFTPTGQLAKQERLGNAAQLEHSVRVDDLAPGIYLVKTSLGEKSSVRRLVVR